MAVNKYNPKRITGSWKGNTKGDGSGRNFALKFIGFMSGSFIEAEYKEDRVTVHTGSQGDKTFVVNCDKGATLAITFIQGADINDDLSDLQPDADNNYMPTGQLSFEDLNGTTKVSAEIAVIAKVAKVEFSNDVTGRQWTFELANATIHVGAQGDF